MYVHVKTMALERSIAIKQMESFSLIISEHIIKLVMYSAIQPNNIDGWIHTIANWIHQADDIKLKPNAKKPDKHMIESKLFRFMGDDIRDYERMLWAFQADNLSGKFNFENNGPYPQFEIDDDASRSLMIACNLLLQKVTPLLIDKQDHTLAEYEAVVASIFK